MLSSLLLLPSALIAAGAGLAYAISRTDRPGAARRAPMRSAPPLSGALPYWDLTPEGVLIGVDLSFTCLLELGGLDSDCMSAGDLDQVDASLRGLFQLLPPGAHIQSLFLSDRNHETTLAAHAACADTERMLCRAATGQRIALIRSARHLLRARLYLAITLPPPAGKRPRRMRPPSLAAHNARLADALRLSDQVRGSLGAAGVSARPLSVDDTRTLLFECLNPPPRPASPRPDPRRSLREALTLTGASEHPRSLRLGGRRLRVLTLAALPAHTDAAMAERLTARLSFPCHVSMTARVLDDARALDQLKMRRNRADALASLGQRRNQEAEAQFRDAEDLIDQHIDAAVRIVTISLTVVLSVPDGPAADAALDEQTAETMRHAAALGGAELIVEEYGQLDAFARALPGGAPLPGRTRRATSRNAAHGLLVWQGFSGHKTPRILLESGRNGLVGLDPFDGSLDNPNAFMAGASGSGKSVTTGYLLLSLIASGASALIVDVGGSYRRLIELAGGDYLSFESESDPALNLLFDPQDALGAGGALDPLRRQFMCAALESLLREPGRPALSNAQRWVLDRAVTSLYAALSPADPAPVLPDLMAVLETARWDDPADAAIARDLRRGLRVWTDGPCGRLLSRPSNITLRSDLCAFDLKGLPDVAREPVLLILSGMIWNLLTKDPARPKVVVFDEVWKLLASPASAKLLAELYRTSRKYRAQILSISQSAEDFTESDIAAALVGNAATAYLLRHRTGHDEIARVFDLNERERTVFGQLEMRRGEYAEALVLAGDKHHFVARVVLTPLEYWITTTHPPDLARLARVQDEHPHLTLLDALRLCASRWPRGAEAAAPPAAGPAPA